MIRNNLFLFSFIFLGLVAEAQTTAPKYSNEFLSIGVGARALAMGNAQVAIVNDGTSAFWNPAGLMKIKSNIQVNLMHAEYFAGIAKFDYGTVAAPIDATSVMAATVIRFGVDDIPDTSELIDASGNIMYDRIKAFSASDYGFLFSYAKKANFLEGLTYGGNVKVIYRNVGPFAKAWGFGLDIGAQYERNNWSFGVLGKDITSTFNAWSFNVDRLRDVYTKTGNKLPENSLEITLPKLIPGVAYKFTLPKKFTAIAALDLDFTFDGKRNVPVSTKFGSIDPHIGVEFGYDNFIFLRGGLNNLQAIKQFDGSTEKIIQPNLGVGLQLKRVSLDYALTNPGKNKDVPYSHIISLKIDIYKSAN